MMKPRTQQIIKWWLNTLCLFILAVIVIGGITRITDSGLSMVQWKPISGIVPPLTETAWTTEFNHYKAYPEYQQYNMNMTLSEFKGIFFWEYLHRILARCLGLVALIPFLGVILWRSDISTKQKIIYGCIPPLIACQGLLGWYMVKSGLVDQPNVSHIRLAAHLLMALGLFSYTLWHRISLSRLAKTAAKDTYPVLFHVLVVGLVILTISQMTYGAFMAGLKAGYGFNTFPKMGSEWAPAIIWSLTPGWKNVIHNPYMVQFIHRTLAWLLVIGGYSLFFYGYRVRLPKPKKIGVHLFTGLLTLQFILGVTTLLLKVHAHVAITHQLIGTFLVGGLVYLCHQIYGAGLKQA